MSSVPSPLSFVCVADPMCSWCYGFAPSLSAVLQRWPNLPLSIVMGGLRVTGEPLDARLKAFLQHHWREVAQRSGQRFDESILEREDFVYTTEPACRAVVTVREHYAALALPMLEAVQTAFYANCRDTTDTTTLADIAHGVGMDRTPFLEAFDSQGMRTATQRDFGLARQWGVFGFPTLIALRGDKREVVAPGWIDPATLLARLANLLER
jgi:putative protein-disulfide isomerase